jgi:ankyrin repeat protein
MGQEQSNSREGICGVNLCEDRTKDLPKVPRRHPGRKMLRLHEVRMFMFRSAIFIRQTLPLLSLNPHPWPGCICTYTKYERIPAPLQAAESSNIDAMVAALREGVALGVRDTYGNTALHRAAHHGNIEGVELLLSAGANPLITNSNGQTPADGNALRL